MCRFSKKFCILININNLGSIYQRFNAMASRPTSKKLKKTDSGAHTQLEAREFDMVTRKHLEEIDGCQTELENLNEQAGKEIVVIEQRFNKLRKPFFNSRSELIAKIPNFWTTAFSNHPDLSNLISSDNVEDCFHHLTKIEVEEAADIKSGFRFEFHFSENPYFHNDMLAKEYQISLEGVPSCMCTSVDWKEGMSLIPRDTSVGRSTQKRKSQQYSFFQWFNDHYDPSGDNIAEIIKDDLWQNPLQYFLTPDVDINNGVDDDEEEEDESEADEEDPAKQEQINPPVSSETTALE